MKIFLGEYEVVESKFLGAITINLGSNVHITIHLGSTPVQIKPGTKLPLYTEIPLAQPSTASKQ